MSHKKKSKLTANNGAELFKTRGFGRREQSIDHKKTYNRKKKHKLLNDE
jgi:hypothetical protein